MKTCIACSVPKPITEFSPAKRNKDGRVSTCKTCMAEYHRKRYNKERDSIDGIFNVDAEMRWLCLDMTPNHLYTGEPQMSRMRIDHTIAVEQKFIHTTFRKTA